jgi:UDP:flavonoid glycosyltransferase YjiC (YdhE family)
MRILFTSQPGAGHWHPLIGVAKALETAGHQIAFASTPKACSAIEANGITCFPVGRDESDEEFQKRRRFQVTLSPAEQAAHMVTTLFAGVAAERALPEMMAVGRTWQPAVVVRDNLEFSGFLMAEALGVPHAVVQVTAWRPSMHQHAVEALDRLRSGIGLPSDPDPARLFRHLLFIPRPPSLLDQAALPATAHIIQPLIFDQSGDEQLPAWVDELPDQPLVYATLGTVFNQAPGVLESIIKGLRDEAISLVVTTGRDQDPAALGSQPPNVHIERYIPQSLLFPRCDVIVTHGGSGTVMAALQDGLPMVIIPIAADQPLNAQRCAELGVGRVIEPASRTPEAIREATRDVLVDPQYWARAEQIRDEITELPGSNRIVRLIENLATNGPISPGI